MNYPKIRPAISIYAVEEHDGQELIYLHDQERYSEYVIGVPRETFAIVRFFDGNHSHTDIQERYKRKYGKWVTGEQIRQLVEELDHYLLLESPRFSLHLDGIKREFARLAVRPSSHQGSAYPEERQALTRTLDGYFRDAKGPGELRPHPGAVPPKAIMAPHIDLKAGGPTFAWAYHALAASDAEVFVILGTSHVGMDNVFALTRKRFETPYRQVPTEQTFVNQLASELSYNPLDDELIHKSEHSIEFQVVFLQYFHDTLRRNHRPPHIVPILCGGEMLEAIVFNTPLEHVPQLEESITALKRVLSRYPNACVIASVDLSHIGPRYGDIQPPDQKKLDSAEHTDRALLKTLEQGDPQAFVTQLRKNRNKTNVCGIVPIYILLRLLEGSRGKLLHYDRTEFGKDSYVSFASMMWT